MLGYSSISSAVGVVEQIIGFSDLLGDPPGFFSSNVTVLEIAQRPAEKCLMH